jgi:N-sulfoglucosamine sulfohydrolase
VNVLLIVSEDNGPHLSCYGDPHVSTPHLDRLASEGIRFTNAYTTQAVCSPGRASIHTGLYPHQNGQIGLATHQYFTFDGLSNLPALMKNAGYRTGMIGKLHILPEAAYPLDLWWNDREFISFQNRDVPKMASVADTFINESDTPFFLTVNYPDCHLPFHRQQFGVPEKPYEADDVTPPPQIGIDTPRLRQHTADYYNCMSRLDTAVGHLLDALEKSGKTADTLVLFTTDHGAQFSRGKTCCYEGGVKVPAILRWPGHVGEGLVSDALVSHIDVMPTILDAIGANIPTSIAGRSYLPVARRETTTHHDHLFTEWCSGSPTSYFPQRSVRDARYKLIVNCLDDRPSPSARGYSGPGQLWEPGATVEEIDRADQSTRDAYATYLHPPREELYDLANDPFEFRNLAGNPERANIQDHLRSTLSEWQTETNDHVADPEILARLTDEHDAILAAHYQTGDLGDKRRENQWRYAEYLQ